MHSWCYFFLKNKSCSVGHSGKGEKHFFMNGENTIWKRWCLGLAKFNPVLPLYKNCPIDVLRKSVGWFLYNGNIGLNGKVDAWLR